MKFYVPAALPLGQELAVPRRKLMESVWKGTNAVASVWGPNPYPPGDRKSLYLFL